MLRIARSVCKRSERLQALDPQAACKIGMSFSGAHAHIINCRATPGMQMTQNVTRREGEGEGEGGREGGEGGGLRVGGVGGGWGEGGRADR